MSEFATPADIKRAPTPDLEMEYFNLKSFIGFECVRAFGPTILFGCAIAIAGWVGAGETQPEWLSQMFTYLIGLTAFTCAAGITYFGGRAWRHLRVVVAIHRELQTRSDRQIF